MKAVKAEELFEQYWQTKDVKVRNRLVSMYEGVVRCLAAKFSGKGEPFEDLYQVGTIGLISAIERYNPSFGVKFLTFAAPTIVGEIKRYFRDRGWVVKVPRGLRELSRAINQATELLSQILQREPKVEEIAEALEVSEADVIKAANLETAYLPLSLDQFIFDEVSEEGNLCLTDFLGEEDAELLALIENYDLRLAMEKLEDSRLKTIIHLRFCLNLTQAEVAKRVNLSQMQVSRLQTKALVQLERLLRDSDRELPEYQGVSWPRNKPRARQKSKRESGRVRPKSFQPMLKRLEEKQKAKHLAQEAFES